MFIEFTKEVIFKDMLGNVVKVYSIGDRLKYTYKFDTYWVTAMGGIYFDEAVECEKQTKLEE